MDVSVFGREAADFEAALDVRERVFVDEQDVPYDREVDGRDPDATHFLVRDDSDPIATARVRPYDGSDERALKVERVAVVADRRGEGYGDAVMDAVESYATEEGYDRLVLDAQVPVVGFYERRGYTVQDDEPFDDAGIPHRRIAKPA
jgi:predicted GNAT family N-acyltransferase